MRHRDLRILVSALAVGFQLLPAWPVYGQDESRRGAERRLQAVRISEGRITVDGQLSEQEWELAIPATDFIQQEPSEGALGTESSEVRVLYDNDVLYVGAMLYDSEPDRLVSNELKHDFTARNGDMFCVMLDTFRDKLTGYSFCAEPSGARRDSQVADDGRANNASWDGVWYVQTSIVENGWIVEISFPFRSLRFPESDDQEWGLNFGRLVRRNNELTAWSFIPRGFGLSKVSYGGVLEGINHVQPGRDIRVTPFGIVRGRGQGGTHQATADGGIDVKVGLGTNFVLDGTYRTDFAQVEVDEQQINLTRFSLFFPEKREFFLENQGAFNIGSTQSRNNLVPFFSRRIGLSESGETVPLVGGLRLSGRSGRNTLGLLNIQTEREERPGSARLPASNFSVFRYGREFLNNSSASVFYLGHERGEAFNRVVGSDIELKFHRRLDVDGFWMRSQDAATGPGTAWRGGFNYVSPSTRLASSYTSLGDTFKDDLGFVPRQGVDIITALAAGTFRPTRRDGPIRDYGPTVSYTRFNKDGFGAETETVDASFRIELNDSSTVRVGYKISQETLFSPFQIRPTHAIPPGRHEFNQFTAGFSTSRAHRFAFNGAYRTGGFWNGHSRGFTAGGRVRMNMHLATSLNFSRDAVDLPLGSFDTNLVSLRVDGSFTTRMFLNAVIQYNSVTGEVQSNVRFNVIHHPLSDLFVVYNDTRATTVDRLPSRSLIVKLTHMLSF